jgi:hypothetical protein
MTRRSGFSWLSVLQLSFVFLFISGGCRSFSLMEQKGLIVFWVGLILSLVAPAAAWDGGDTTATILFTVIGLIAICAVLGWWARRQGAA